MKRFAWTIIVLLGFYVVITVGVILLKNPPLTSNGLTEFNIPGNELKYSIVIENHEIEQVTIKEVLINGEHIPDRTAIGVGSRLVLGEIENYQDISFHSIKDFTILPMREVTAKGNRVFLNYGVQFWNEEPVDSVAIHYTYFGIPYTLNIEPMKTS